MKMLVFRTRGSHPSAEFLVAPSPGDKPESAPRRLLKRGGVFDTRDAAGFSLIGAS
jgi:hypothetical protein